jgi:hypothetical protein
MVFFEAIIFFDTLVFLAFLGLNVDITEGTDEIGDREGVVNVLSIDDGVNDGVVISDGGVNDGVSSVGAVGITG